MVSRSPDASLEVSKQLGESRLLRTETATNTEQKLCPGVFVLAIRLFYCVSSRHYNSGTALHSFTSVSFSVVVGMEPRRCAFITLVRSDRSKVVHLQLQC